MDVRVNESATLQNKIGPYGYVVIYLGWAWFFWTLIILSGQSVWTFPNVLFFYIGALSPALAGIVLTYRTQGRAGLSELWDRIRNPRRIPLRWYAVILFLYPIITLSAAALAAVLGPSDAPPLDPASTVERLTNPLGLFAFVGFTLGAGLVEETGSTGFFLDRLMKLHGAVAAGVISGAVWASWHIPLFLMEGYFSQAAYQPIVWRFFITFVFLETIYAWIYDHTDRSVLAAVLFHMMLNLTGEVLAPSQQVRWYTFYLTILATTVIVIWQWRNRTYQQCRPHGDKPRLHLPGFRSSSD